MSFSSDIKKFVRHAKGNEDKLVRKVIIDLGTSLVLKTPVGNFKLWKKPVRPKGYVGGRARGNWQYAENVPNTSATGRVDRSGASTISNITSKVGTGVAGKKHFITNTLPYIKPLENGHSKQAPSGMVALTVVEFKKIVKDAVRNLP